MSPTPGRIRSMRTVTAMVALDTVEAIAERVCNLLAHGRRVSMTERYTYVGDAPSLAVGLTLDGEPKLWRRDGGVGLSVQLKPGLTAGFGLSAYADEAPTEARAWARYHHEKGYDGKPRNLTVVDIQGGLTGDGPARDDQLVIHDWNTHGVCAERVIGFDYDTVTGQRDPLRDDLRDRLANAGMWPELAMLDRLLAALEANAAEIGASS